MLAIGTKVIVITSSSDPIQLVLSPHTVVAAMVDGPQGPMYVVEHLGSLMPRRFGPFPADRLIKGWDR
jgi:hypothetical protein